MRLRYTASARRHLQYIFDFIAERNPPAARRVITEIRTAATRLSEFPHRGRTGQQSGTRELVVLGTPYIVIYEIWPASEEIVVLAIMHGAQDRGTSSEQIPE